MTELEALARKVGSRRYARDLIEEAKGGPRVLAKPWWDMPGGNGERAPTEMRKPIFMPECWPFK